MSRQDHAQQPLLRRLIRRIGDPSDIEFRRICLLEVELSAALREHSDLGAETTRVLVTAHGQPLGVLELASPGGHIAAATLDEAIRLELSHEITDHLRRDAADQLSPIDSASLPNCRLELEPDDPAPLVSIVIPTRNRAAHLSLCIKSLQGLTYPHFEVLVVDNAPSDDATAKLIEATAEQDRRFTYVLESSPGASFARNLGAQRARGDIVAFTDDDVIVDPQWLTALAAGFRSPGVQIVSGLTLPARLETAAQHAFELFGGMSRGFAPRVYDLNENRGDTLLYPYTAGIFGASNNVAFRRAPFVRSGGFDLALGPATPAYSAEDLDAFLAVILSGQQILYEPRAMVKHDHRSDFAELYWQVFTYSTGSAALLTKWSLSNRSVAIDLARRIPKLLPAALFRPQRSGAEAGVGAYPAQLRWLERVGFLYGPIAYLRSVWYARRRARPLKAKS